MNLRIESDFIYKGLRCVVIIMPLGCRYGYVGVPPENMYYGKSHNDLKIECHGGIIYSSNIHPVTLDLWWFGFDCGHYEGKVISLEYVQNECRKIVDQLLKD